MRRRYPAVLTAIGFGFLMAAGQAQAQTPLAFVAGPSFANISSDEFDDTSSKTGFFVGAGTSFDLSERFSISPYLVYVQKGAEFGSNGDEDTYTYLEIPVLLGTTIPVGETAGLGISLGPQIAFNIECTEVEVGEADDDCSEFTDFKGTEFGLLGSTGLSFPMGDSSIAFGVAYDLGLTDVFEEIDGGFKNRVVYLWASYGITVGGM